MPNVSMLSTNMKVTTAVLDNLNTVAGEISIKYFNQYKWVLKPSPHEESFYLALN